MKPMKTYIKISLLFLLSFFAVSFLHAQEQVPTKTRILFIFDGSNSMNAQWEKGTKIKIEPNSIVDASGNLVEGELTNENQSINFVIKDLNWNEKAVVIAKNDLRTDQILGTAKVNDIEVNCSFSMLDRLSVGCIEYADFLTKSEVTFPKTRNQNFNELIEEEIQNWLKLSRAYTKEYLATVSSLTTENRLALRSYCWYEIDCFNSRIVSGKIIQTNTW